jgi:DinB family protein
MNTRDLSTTLTTLFGELLEGPSPDAAYMLNRGDVGLLGSLDRLSAAQASAVPNGGASIAAHVAHLAYGLSLMNRWSAGENPFDTADWSASWRTATVSPVEWEQLKAAFVREARRWLEALQLPRDVTPPELNGLLGSIAHLAYHLGSIRQIDRSARGPAEPDLVRS